eukprot:6197798-Pleurochrysis_carterae.AAC.1
MRMLRASCSLVLSQAQQEGRQMHVSAVLQGFRFHLHRRRGPGRLRPPERHLRARLPLTGRGRDPRVQDDHRPTLRKGQGRRSHWVSANAGEGSTRVPRQRRSSPSLRSYEEERSSARAYTHENYSCGA